MKEEFLHFIWKYSYYHKENIYTNTGEKVQIISNGEHNHDSGPDFINAKIKIGKTLWAGNVEIHLCSSDWNRHFHSQNKDYNNVILQVVLKDDCIIKRDNGEIIPAIELKFDEMYFNNYKFLQESRKWIACEDKIQKTGNFKIHYWLNTLAIERYMEKANEIRDQLHKNINDLKEVFYISLAKSFGLKINSQPFEQLAKSLPFKLLSKYRDNRLYVEALLFGQAGFLQENINDEYYFNLQKEYLYFRKKHKLIPLNKHIWKFLRLRPCNFPTIRISQFAGIICGSPDLYSLITENPVNDEIMKYLRVKACSYWNNHYIFGKESKHQIKKTGDNFIRIIMINTIVPFLFCYGEIKRDDSFKMKALSLLESCKPENNAVIRNWSRIGIVAKNSLESQALLQLKNKYCKNKLCLYCQLGNTIITI